jgi:hypothetical protein
MEEENGVTEETVIEEATETGPKVYSAKKISVVVGAVTVEISRAGVERRLDDADTIRGLIENDIAVKIMNGETTLDEVFGA